MELAIIEHARDRTITGTPEQVRERLLAMATRFEVDELVVVTITHEFAARKRSYELLIGAFQ